MIDQLASLATLTIVLRTMVIFIFAFLVIRLRGKRQLGQLSLFDTIVIIALGSAVGDVMIYPQEIVSLERSIIAITTLILFVMVVEYFVARAPKNISDVIYGEETVIVFNGQLVPENFKKTMITEDQLLSRLRERGIRDYSNLKFVRLEPDGDISIQTYEDVDNEESQTSAA